MDLRLHEEPDGEWRQTTRRIVGPRHLGDEVDHAGARIQLTFRAHDARSPSVFRARETRLQDDPREFGRAALHTRQGQRQEGQFLIPYRQPDLGEVDGVERRDGLAPVDELAGVDALAAHAPVEGSGHARAFQVPLRPGDPCGRFAERGARDGEPVQCLVVARLADGLGLAQLLVPLIRLLGVREFALRGRQVRARPFQGDLVVDPLDLDQDIAFLEEPARDHRLGHGQNPTGDLRDQVALGLGYDGAVCGDGRLHGSRVRHHRAHGGNVRRRRHRIELRAAHEYDRSQRQTCDGGENGGDVSPDHDSACWTMHRS